MKKVLIGCGIVALIGVIIVCGAGIFLVGKAKKIGQSIEQVVMKIDDGVTEVDGLFPFDLPEPLAGEEGITAERFDKMIEVRQAACVEIRESSLYAFIQEVERSQQQGNNDFPIFKFIGAIEEMGPDAEAILAAMFQELKNKEMSYAEYWHLTISCVALMVAVGEQQVDVEDFPPELQAQFREVQRMLNDSPQTQFEFDRYLTSWRTADEEKVKASLQILVEHKEELEQVKESYFFDFILKLIEQQAQAMNSGG